MQLTSTLGMREPAAIRKTLREVWPGGHTGRPQRGF